MFNFFSFLKPEKSVKAAAKNLPLAGRTPELEELIGDYLTAEDINLTVADIKNCMRDADYGDPARQALLFELIQEREPEISAHLETRKRATLGCPWSIHGPDEERCRELEAILRAAGLNELKRHLLADSLPHGYAGASIVWAPGGGEIESFKMLEAKNFVFNCRHDAALRRRDGQAITLDSYHPNQFVMHYAQMKSGLPCRGGLLRSLVWYFFFKHFAFRDSARFFETFGIPFRLAKISEADFADPERLNAILATLRQLGGSGVGAVPESADLQVLDVKSGDGAGFFEFFNYIDDQYALLILGQIASSKSANGMSNGNLQAEVKSDMKHADCAALSATLSEQIVKPLSRFRYGTVNEYSLEINPDPPEDLERKAKIVSTLSSAGFNVDPAWVSRTFNIPLLEGGG